MAFSDFLKVWLTFDTDATTDNAGNSWSAYNNPSVSSTNAKVGNALQLAGGYTTTSTSGQYLQLDGSFSLGGQDFTIDGWACVDSNCGSYARIFSIFNSFGSNGNYALTFSANKNTSGFYINFNGSSTSNAYITKGTLFHFAVVYQHSISRIDFFIDGSKIGSINKSFPRTSYQYLFLGRANYNANDTYYFKGSIDEFRIYDGIARWTDNFTPPSAADYLLDFSFVVDAERKIKNAPLTWRYENAGTADLLTVSGTTLTDLPVTQSKTGSAFYQTARVKCFDIPATKEIWLKFDVYFTPETKWRAYNDSFGGAGNYSGICSQSNGDMTICASGAVIDNVSNVLKNQLQTVLLYMVSDSSGGVVEAWLDGEKLYTYTGNVNNGEDFADIFLQSDGAGTFFSNVIISNAEIALDENVASDIHFDVSFDAQRLVGNTVSIDFDAQRIISPPNVHFDTTFDAQRLVYRSVIFDADTQRIVKKSFTVDFDAERIITTAPTTLVHLSFDELEPDTGTVFGYYATPYFDEGGRQWDNPRSSSYVTKTNAKSGNALTMDGNGYLTHDGSFSLGGQDFTVDGWAFIDSDCADCTIATFSISYSDYYSLRFKDGKFVFSHSNEDLTADFAIVNHWFYFAISYQHSTGTITLFINGVDVAHFNAQIERNDYSVVFGDGLLGYLDELRVIDGRALWYNPEHFDVNFDAEISFSNNYNFITIDFDSCRNVHRTVNFLVDTCRNISHKFIMTPAKDGILYADAAESTGIQSLQIDIAPQQITDQFSFTAVNDVDILQNVKGQYLDYVFDLRIEKITKKGILNTCLCCSDVDKILYTQLAYKVQSTSGGLFVVGKDGKTTMQEKPKASAHTHISKIADILGKNLVYLADEFTSTVDTDPEGVTYNDLIRDIFGWSSRVPTKLINCYIRNDSLYVVQRGHEQNTIDISNAKIANTTITKELFRTTWGSTPTSWTVTQKNTTYGDWEPILGDIISDEEPSPGGDDEPLPPEPDDTSRVLPRRVVTDEFGVTTTVEYDYDDDGNVIRTTTITEFSGVNEGMTVVENSYTTIDGRKMLASETTSEYDWDLEKSDWQFVDQRTVHHSYLTQGQQNVTAFDAEGKIKGSLTTSSRTDDRPTPFENSRYNKDFRAKHGYDNIASDQMIDMWNALRMYTYVDGVKYEVLGFQKKKSSEDKEITNYGIALYDSSFPIDDIATLSALTAELRRLNRTTQESISLDIYDFPHVFDFNDRIILGGNEYFLDSNSVSKTPRIVNKQSLKLVRWY